MGLKGLRKFSRCCRQVDVSVRGRGLGQLLMTHYMKSNKGVSLV